MTTAHELARTLLAGPDHPVVLSIVARHVEDPIYSDSNSSLDVDEALWGNAHDDVILITGDDYPVR